MAVTIKNTAKDLKKQRKLAVLDGAKAYVQLRQAVIDERILDRDYFYYLLVSLIAFGGFFISAYQLYIQTSYWALALWALLFSFFSVQIAGILHDAGHRAIFQSTRNNDIIGTICGAMLAMVHHNWRIRHNTHHAHTNEETVDPDINIPLLSFTQERFQSKTGIAKFLRPYQVFFYFPIGMLINFALRIEGVGYFRRNLQPSNWWRIGIYLIGLFAWFVLPFVIFDFGKGLFVFAFIHLLMGLYAWNIFAPNHKGNPHFEKGVKFSFFEHQVLTSRNIHGHPLTDIFYMGLNYQIEHHLFPNCPRNKLKLIVPHVQKLCRQLKLEYEQVSVLESNKIILSELTAVSDSH